MSGERQAKFEHLKSTRYTKELGKVGVVVAGGFLAALPTAVAIGITTTEVRETGGPIPVTISPSPGYSGVETGLFGSFYNDSEEFTEMGIGATLQIDSPPSIFTELSDGDVTAVVEPLSGFYQDPERSLGGYQQALSREVTTNTQESELVLGVLMTLIGSALVFRRSQSGRDFLKRAGIASGTLFAISGAMAGVQLQQWYSENALPEPKFTIDNLPADSFLAGTTANTTEAALIAERLGPVLDKAIEREKLASEVFIEQAKQTIDIQLSDGSFAAPKEGEAMALILSDMHSNYNMTEIYRYAVEKINEVHGEETVTLVLFAGDQSYGSSAESSAIAKMANIADEAAGVRGNHDGDAIGQAMDDSKMIRLNGETVEFENGLSALGGDDPSETRFNDLLGGGRNISRDGSGISQKEAGAKLIEEAEMSRPTFLLTHEAYELAPQLGVTNITKETMATWFDTPSYSAGPKPSVFQVPFAGYGHWHDLLKTKTVPLDRGGDAVIAEFPTAGGASSEMRLSDMSFPFTTPAKNASGIFVTVDLNEQLVTGVQEMLTDTNGRVQLLSQEEFNQNIDQTDMNLSSRDQSQDAVVPR